MTGDAKFQVPVYPCPKPTCRHLSHCEEATRRRAEGGHTVTLMPSPKMDAPGLIKAVCSCTKYATGPRTWNLALASWRQHADDLMGYRPPIVRTGVRWGA